VTKVMTKNIEDLLYRGDSLERMGEMSGRLKEDSRKYKRAAVRINWELLLKQVSRIFRFNSLEPQDKMEKLAVMIYELTLSIVRTNRRVNLYHGHLYMVAFLLNGEQGLETCMVTCGRSSGL